MLMARLSLMAYSYEEMGINNDLQVLGLNKDSVFSHGAAKGFIADSQVSDEEVIVVFKGTNPSNIQEAWADLDFAAISCGFGSPSYCHKRFIEALDSVYGFIQHRLSELRKKEIYITGHGLGAALANILAYQLSREPQFESTNLITYTFGCPSVGDKDFAAAVGNTGAKNIVFDDDFISKTADPGIVKVNPFLKRPTDKFVLPYAVVKIGNAPSQVVSRKLPATYQNEIAGAEDIEFDSHSIENYIKVLEMCSK